MPASGGRVWAQSDSDKVAEKPYQGPPKQLPDKGNDREGQPQARDQAGQRRQEAEKRQKGAEKR